MSVGAGSLLCRGAQNADLPVIGMYPRRLSDEQVVEDGHRLEELEVLEGTRDAVSDDVFGRSPKHVDAVEADSAAVGVIEPPDAVEYGGLARAVRAD
ncbi:MAG TPA: hypothetical protein VIO16_01290 [Dehalococcoidia bacterium]|jgi:hypothetical protein